MNDEKDLNQEQKKAVLHEKGPLFVLAGAGSGKTRVIIYRIATLIQRGVSPDKILAVTFTNKAAAEMKTRLLSLVETKSPLTCTFHSLGARLLRSFIHHIGYENSFTIYDEKDCEDICKGCMQALGIPLEKKDIKRIKTRISRLKNLLVDPDRIKDYEDDEEMQKIYPMYQNKMKEYNALDFDDLLFLAVKVLQKDEVQSSTEDLWEHVLVDEYQDTNHAQVVMCQILTKKSKNLFAVGDPDQSIYSWRGANMGHVARFSKDFPGANTITLAQNYRSTNCILRAANCIIRNNVRPYEKDLFSNLGDGEKVEVARHADDRREANYVSSIIRRLLRDHSALDIAILYRTNAQSRSLEDAFLKNRIPYVILGGLSFYQRKEIKDLLAFLRLVVSPADFVSFVRTIQIPKRGFGAKILEQLKCVAEHKSLPILDVCEQALRGEAGITLRGRQKEGMQDYLQIFHKIKAQGESLSPFDALEKIIQFSRYDRFLQEDPESFEDRKENVFALLAKAKEWEEETEEPTLEKFLEELSLKSSAEEVSEEKESIRMMSLHHSKGLEFPICFLVGMEEDLFPHIQTKDDPTQIEEERRLCYVGMTRAKKMLYLTYATSRFLWGVERRMRPSRFLKELPEKECTGQIPAFSQREFIQTGEPEEKTQSSAIQVGSRVRHKVFGQGVVKKIYETSFGQTFDVQFLQETGVKSLAQKYAQLQLV